MVRFPVSYGIFRNQIVHIHRVRHKTSEASSVEE